MDLNHFWSGDLTLSPSGDLALASGDINAQQQLLRALMTNPALADSAGNPFASPDYTFHATWGAGIPRRIGRTLAVNELRAQIVATAKTIDGIAQSPPPTVAVTPINNGAAISISYTDATTNQPVTLSFDINQ